MVKRCRQHPEPLQPPVNSLVPSSNCAMIILIPRRIRLPHFLSIHIDIFRYYFPNSETVLQVITKNDSVRVRPSWIRARKLHNLTDRRCYDDLVAKRSVIYFLAKPSTQKRLRFLYREVRAVHTHEDVLDAIVLVLQEAVDEIYLFHWSPLVFLK